MKVKNPIYITYLVENPVQYIALKASIVDTIYADNPTIF